MNESFFQRLALRQNLLFMVAVCLCVYFGYHTLHGNRGVFKLISLTIQTEKQQTRLDETVTQREALERDVVMMRDESLNLDLLEERVRHMLGYKKEGEHQILPRYIMMQ